MYGRHHSHGGPRRPPPEQPQLQPPNYFSPPPPQNYFTPPLQNPNFNPYLQYPNPYISAPPPFFPIPQPRPPPQPQQSLPQPRPPPQQPQHLPSSSPLMRIEQAVVKAHREILAAGESVSAWSISKSVLSSLKADSWSTLGFQIQEIPTLYRLMQVEGKVNAFIHCYVGVRKILSLHDLNVEICKSEGVQRFDELELGPFLRHPLVIHYFLVPPDTKEIVNITCDEIISYLVEFSRPLKGKNITTEGFLEFLAVKRPQPAKEKLGIRIQNLRMYVKYIKEAKTNEKEALNKYIQKMKKASKEKNGKSKISQAPSMTLQKSFLKKRYFAIQRRVKSFSPILEDSTGKHIRFISSSSDDEDEDEDEDNDVFEKGVENADASGSQSKIGSQNRNISDQRVSSCPYPSATEEKARLGLKIEIAGQSSPACDRVICDKSKQLLTKKRKCESQNTDYPLKLSKRDNADSSGHDLELLEDTDGGKSKSKNQSGVNNVGYVGLTDEALEEFITTWKDACRVLPVPEVLDRMIHFYSTPKPGERRPNKTKLQSVFKSFPCSGLLHLAVSSIKNGMWDSLYDAFQGIGERGCVPSSAPTEGESISVEPSNERDVLSNKERSSQLDHCIHIDDICKKVSSYFDHNHTIPVEGKSALEKQFIFLRKLHDCQIWLANQFSVKKFSSLGHGEFHKFLEEHPSLIPNELLENLLGDVCKSTLEVSMHQHQLIILLSQAESCLQKNETLTVEYISDLLSKQFPVISLQVRGDVSSKDVSGFLKKHKNINNHSAVLFSVTLLRSHHGKRSLMYNDTHLLEHTELKQDMGLTIGALGSVSAKDAVECLLKAPMLSDIQSWSHWDLIYAPTLGPLVQWLINEVHMKELMCLVTNDGKIMRIDNSATVDEFLEALLKRSAYEAAVKLLSLFSLYGGEGHVPLSLLKCHAQRGIENILINPMESMTVRGNHNSYLVDGKVLGGQCAQEITVKQLYLNILDKHVESLDLKDQHRINVAVSVASRFILDCICYLPSECHSFAADVLLSGLQAFTKDAPLTILRECNQTHQRVMLHNIGLSLNICEWIADYHSFSSGASNDSPQAISSGSTLVSSHLQSVSKFKHDELEEPLTSDYVQNIESDEPKEVCDELMDTNVNQVPPDMCEGGSLECYETCNGNLIVESIRCEEFGLVSNRTEADNIMLKKQHARLGRALQCLSQELYSQDSHFLLELVQNADDNIYSEVVEPTLVFILQSTGIVVLNNEQGFTAQNIKALCDVGNSTKKGANAGYIGQKGIGFKSVFRVTDAPEIHSNGFNVKFDISEGQIGFVLPTVVPPCDIASLRRLLPDEVNRTDSFWNTCIVLPFKTKLRDGMGLSTIVSLFSDLHPSLLLFLHRLQCIKFKNMLNDTYTVMKRENLEDGIVKVSHGQEIMSWFVASQNLQASVLRPDVQTTKISLAFTLKESPDGDYVPHLEQQPVFAFLPLRRYGLKFILQGDFLLPSSREEVDADSAWNQWLLSEFPSLFFSAQRSFCNLHCFQKKPGKAVAAYMSFVPLVGEVHGFFAQLPRMIISKLRISNCLLVDGKDEWVPPCRVLRGWHEQARILLPDKLLYQHLGLSFLDKDIVLSDSLAKALGVSEYGPKILVDIISSICRSENGIKPHGLDWLSFCLDSLYMMLAHSSGHSSVNAWVEADLIDLLRKIPFIPLSDGTYGSIAEGTIWLTSDAVNSGLEGQYESEVFVNLLANLRLVSPAFLSAASVNTLGIENLALDNVLKMLFKIGVQRLVAHELIRVHVLPALCDDKTAERDSNLMTEYLAFVMLHLQSPCTSCQTERDSLVSELQSKAFILTNHGYKRAGEVPIHFSRVFGNPVDMTKLVDIMNSDWHEVDFMYLKHSSNKSSSFGVMKWREFFLELGVTDFVRTVQVDRNIADVFHTLLGDIMCGGDIIASGTVVRDWESPELVHLLSTLSSQNNSEKSKYLMEVLDKMWDGCFSAKVIGSCVSSSGGEAKQFKSSFVRSINDFQWMASSIDKKLHYPKDLFYDCEEVRSLLGNFAPYAVPQVRSRNFSGDVGLKTRVTVDDAMEVLQVMQNCVTPLTASIDQMSKFYAFIWGGMATAKAEITRGLSSGPFIFLPFANNFRSGDMVSGRFYSSDEVYWHDPTGSLDLTKEKLLQRGALSGTNDTNKMLAFVYPALHDFFVNECKVYEIPPTRSYIQILVQLSNVTLPSQAANAVLRVLLKWANDLKSGLLEPEDAAYLKESLLKLETTVLPTKQDKWVSLHPTFGLVCWCDSEELWKQFKHSDNITFIYFGELSRDEKKVLPTKISGLMQALGIPSLSEVITREAIFYGMDDSRQKALLVNWALPYAQRYIYKLHPDKYTQLKQSGFDNICNLRVVIVEKLFYRHCVKGCDNTSSKRVECSCLLQDNNLYIDQASTSHPIFMELSRLFFNGTPELHLANFLHMITTMAESGSNEEQTDLFVVNSQKIPKLPDGEPVWFLSSARDEQNLLKLKRKPSISTNWPPADWRNAPDFGFPRENRYRTIPAVPQPSDRLQKEDDIEGNVHAADPGVTVGTAVDWVIDDKAIESASAMVLQDMKARENTLSGTGPSFGKSSPNSGELQKAAGSFVSSENLDSHFKEKDQLSYVTPMQRAPGAFVNSESLDRSHFKERDQLSYITPTQRAPGAFVNSEDRSHFRARDQLSYGTPNEYQAAMTGRLGELVASSYFSTKFDPATVNWVNEHTETGLPYDIVIGEREGNPEYIEVKATKSIRKDWFAISTREWQFAVEKGDSFSIAHIFLATSNNAKVTVFKNPVRLCQQGTLRLAVLMPKNQEDT